MGFFSSIFGTTGDPPQKIYDQNPTFTGVMPLPYSGVAGSLPTSLSVGGTYIGSSSAVLTTSNSGNLQAGIGQVWLGNSGPYQQQAAQTIYPGGITSVGNIYGQQTLSSSFYSNATTTTHPSGFPMPTVMFDITNNEYVFTFADGYTHRMNVSAVQTAQVYGQASPQYAAAAEKISKDREEQEKREYEEIAALSEMEPA